jgi:hypothetical protein
MIINPYRFAAATTPWDGFGSNSRDFDFGAFIQVNGAEPTAYPFTLAAWIKPDAINIAAQGILCAGDTGGQSKFTIEVNNATIRLRAQGTTNDIFTGGTVTTTSWHHVAAEFKSATSRELWVDGSSVGTGTTTSVTLPTLNALEIGRQIDSSPSNKYTGLIADVRIYNTAIGSSAVSDLASGIHVATGLTGWWLDDDNDILDNAGSNDGVEGDADSTVFSTDGPAD